VSTSDSFPRIVQNWNVFLALIHPGRVSDTFNTALVDVSASTQTLEQGWTKNVSSEPKPTIVSFLHARVVKVYYATSSLVRFKKTKYFLWIL
jgi:hypothetical protein